MRHAWIIAFMGIGALVVLTVFMVPPLQQVADKNTGFGPLEAALVREYALESASVSAAMPKNGDPVTLTIGYRIRQEENVMDEKEIEDEMRKIAGFALENLPGEGVKLEKILDIEVTRRQIVADDAPHILRKIDLINPRHAEQGNPYDFDE